MQGGRNIAFRKKFHAALIKAIRKDLEKYKDDNSNRAKNHKDKLSEMLRMHETKLRVLNNRRGTGYMGTTSRREMEMYAQRLRERLRSRRS